MPKVHSYFYKAPIACQHSISNKNNQFLIFPSQYLFTIEFIYIFRLRKWFFYLQTKLHMFSFTL